MKYVETETESWNLKINTPKQHCQTVFYVFIVIFERIFYLGLFFFNVDFEDENDEWGC